MSLPPTSHLHPGSPAPGRELICEMCGCRHYAVALAPGEHARCVRCGASLAKRGRFGPHAPIALALTGLILSVPALLLPFVTAGKFGKIQVNLASTGAGALWDSGMPVLAVWVFACGILAPVLLFATVAALFAGRGDGDPASDARWLRATHALERWAMPEVHVLAVLVALTKLGTLVNVSIGPGFWCYAAMTVVLLLAWRSFEDHATGPEHARPAEAAVP